MTSIANEPLATPSTWFGPDIVKSDDWVRRLTPGQITELENALGVA
ncbi:MAG: TauD/TfdA family dioxygenase, partial [Deltaproteobacteria bacterium]|nr:TauD/TfdA family dioxygenase [Deltaproteobacteria bacterium]